MAVLAGIFMMQGLGKLLMAQRQSTWFAIASIISAIVFLLDGGLSIYWVCASFSRSETAKHYKALTWSFIITMIGTGIYGVLMVLALHTEGKKYLKKSIDRRYGSSSVNSNYQLRTDGSGIRQLTEGQKKVLLDRMMMAATGSVIMYIFTTVLLNFYWLQCAKRYVQIAQRTDRYQQ